MTLVEALLVLMVLSASMLAAPRVGQLFSQRTTVRQDSDVVLRSLRLARETALTRRCSVTVRWKSVRNADGENRTVVDMVAAPGIYSDGADAFGAAASPGASTWMTDPIELHPNVSVRANASSIVFDPTGIANRDLELKVYRDSESIDVFVQAASGNIYQNASP
ncbi:pilus assembly FimT family protein [Rhodopirellula sp. P2]|uniref:pilus assembly FimT family protein n=1 Tax=Rhodopirellula sp. P2 TaxID=2127060 RepID=UPI002367FEAA|nr:GspH/FimT family pseudopilin [Rhodopirellula sp. P2]WDQ19219.1 GspH/FimT family pseudopilin [Rhodopirellula sp. P2]